MVGSFYGISGMELGKQLCLWAAIACVLRSIGLPFVLGGDWQRPPKEMRESGFLNFLNASVCDAREATNIKSGNELDWFVASDSLVGGGWEASTVLGTAFSTHAPVQLVLVGQRGNTPSGTCLATPKPFPVPRLIGPITRKVSIDWMDWGGGAETCEHRHHGRRPIQ